MPEILSEALALPGLPWVAAAAFVAGVVRGFAGFGTAMIYLPVAAQYLPPVWAILTIAVMDIFGPLPIVPAAWRAAHRADLRRLVLGAAVLLPLGIFVLMTVDPSVFRYAVSALALGMLVVLVGGLRYHGPVTPPMVYGIGGAGGFLGGAAGLPGPPVILFYMASPHPARAIRANNMLYLFAYDFLVIGVLFVQGALAAVPLIIGLGLALPALAGNLLGAAIFDPDREKTYRIVAYLVIGASALSGLPFWD